MDVRDDRGVPAPATGSRSGPLLCVSRLVVEAGVDTLLAAFGLLADDRPDLDLEVIGDGPLQEPLRRRTQELGLEERVRFRGRLPWSDVQEAVSHCSVLVVVSPASESGDRHGVPLVLAEGLAQGRPVVITGTVGLPELERHDGAALVSAPSDPIALARALAMLLDDPRRASALGEAGRRLVARVPELCTNRTWSGDS